MDPDHIHFNEWAFLAKTDPEVFERCREQCIEAWLAKAGKHRQCLEALQSRIDAERERANSPEEAVIAISELMCESLSELASELKGLSLDLKNLEVAPEPVAAQRPVRPRRAALPNS